MREKSVVNIFQYDKDYITHTGTLQEIVEKTRKSQAHVRNHSEIVGKRYLEVKMTEIGGKNSVFGSIKEIAEKLEGRVDYVRRAIEEGDGVYRGCKLAYTGRYVFEYSRHIKSPKKEKPKPTIEKKPEPIKPVPMSDYWKMMFEMHTKHLEDYKRGEVNG